MAQETIRVQGLRDLDRALRKLDKDLGKELRDDLKQAGELVRGKAVGLLAPISQRSAQGYQTRVRAGGKVVVEQSRRKTTGQHPEWGPYQMRHALLPALVSEELAVLARVERTLDTLGQANGF